MNNNNEILINEIIENNIISNLLNMYSNEFYFNRRIRNIISRRYYNTPPNGGYIINNDEEYSGYSQDDLNSLVLLDTIQDINNINNNNINKLNSYKRIKDSNVLLLESQCPICLDIFKKNECYRVLSCNHTFHKKCIDRWIKKDKNECPMCRKNIFNNNLII
jgi:hypothetical protein